MEEVKKVPDEETGGGRQNTMKILDKREEAVSYTHLTLPTNREV